MAPEAHEPTIVGFLCNWCSYTAADLAGTSRMGYPHNLRIIRVMSSTSMRLRMAKSDALLKVAVVPPAWKTMS